MFAFCPSYDTKFAKLHYTGVQKLLRAQTPSSDLSEKKFVRYTLQDNNVVSCKARFPLPEFTTRVHGPS